MHISFDAFELDLSRRELRTNGQAVSIEPRVFDLIAHLVEHRDKVVSKQDLTTAVWQGRFISDASLSTAVKSARRALGDSGEAQRFIKTVHGVGFRFIADVLPAKHQTTSIEASARTLHEIQSDKPAHGAGRPSIAVLRFSAIAPSSHGAVLAEALPAELLSALSRMKWLHVIARGSSFRFDPQSFDPEDVARRLRVSYILTGILEPVGSNLAVSLELQSAADGTLVWSDRFPFEVTNVEAVRQEIVAATISAMEIAIPQFEAMRSRVLSASQFDAWSHFHLGLTHAFRFSPQDNQIAAQHFRSALEFDPQFGRAHAGNSFVHWQHAFMRFEDARHDHLTLAVSEAKRALDIDPNDPFGSFCMGRALWLMHDVEAGLSWLDRGLTINPNFAHGHYTKGLISNMKGNYEDAHSATGRAMALSPLDPLYYGMLANLTLTEIARDNLTEAMEFAEKSANAPGTYYYPLLWAAIAAELSGERVLMERWRDRALGEWPKASVEAMWQTFPLRDPSLKKSVEGALKRMGIS